MEFYFVFGFYFACMEISRHTHTRIHSSIYVIILFVCILKIFVCLFLYAFIIVRIRRTHPCWHACISLRCQ